MNHSTKANSLYMQPYLAINLFLIQKKKIIIEKKIGRFINNANNH